MFLPGEPRSGRRFGPPDPWLSRRRGRRGRVPGHVGRADGGSVRRRTPSPLPGPYLLGGYSGGGIVALEMVRRLRELGEQVDHVVLFDSVPPGRAEVPVPTSWWRTCRNALRFGVGAVRPYVRHRAAGRSGDTFPSGPNGPCETRATGRALGFETDSTGTVDLYYYFSAAADRYVPTAYDVDVTIIKADLQ
ncbi:MAG: thioesterase domain-containing protein [Ilumatobacteraceae bacterium]